MVSNSNLTRKDAQFRSESLTITHYDLHLDLSDATTAPTFPVRTTVTLTSTQPEVFVDYLGESVQSVTVNGVEVPSLFDGSRIGFAVPVGEEVSVGFATTSRYSRTGQGLHRFVDPADGNTYLYSHVEPSDARRIYPCFDQPDLKATFSISMTTPDGWVALSNQPEVSAIGSRHQFATTPLLSTYLTAFAAGPYVGVHDQWRSQENPDFTINLGVWVRSSMASHVDSEIMTVTKNGLDYFDAHYGFPYPWGKYDSIFVPEYNLGAMENPGLVTFTESYIFRSPATDAQHAARANTILHEMSHMWFGDLVTPRWWDDLWLKESFAEFMGADASVAATRFSQAWVNFAGNRKNWAYMQDQLPTTHPIKAEIDDVDAARQNFDGITYAKGAAVLKQLVHFVGRDTFYTAAREYFQTYAFSTATFADLLTILQKHTDRDLDDWADRWLLSCGVDHLSPHITVADGVITDLNITQISDTITRPHRIAVSLWKNEGDELARYATFDVDVLGDGGSVEKAIGLPAPDLVVLNDGDHSYALIDFDEQSVATITSSLSKVSDPLTRAVIWTALWNLTRDAKFLAQDFITIALDHVAAESNPTISTQILAHAQFAARHFVADQDRSATFARLASAVHALLMKATPGGDTQLVFARALIAAAPFAGPAYTAQLLEVYDGKIPGLVISPDLRWQAVIALSTLDYFSACDLRYELDRDNTLSGKVAHLQATYSAPFDDVKERIYNRLLQPGEFSNDEVDAMISAFNAPSMYGEFDHTERFFADLHHMWSEHPIEIANRLVRGLFPQTPAALAAGNKLVETNLPTALKRVLSESIDHLARKLSAQKFNF